MTVGWHALLMTLVIMTVTLFDPRTLRMVMRIQDSTTMIGRAKLEEFNSIEVPMLLEGMGFGTVYRMVSSTVWPYRFSCARRMLSVRPLLSACSDRAGCMYTTGGVPRLR